VLIANGWKVLRFWVYELREDMPACVEKIRAACFAAGSQSTRKVRDGHE